MPATYTDARDGLTTSVAVKAPCRVATTANITLSGLQTIDGVVCVAEDRVLVKNQTSAVDNGIWVVGTGAWSRALDFDGALDAVQGTLAKITSGTSNGGSIAELTTSNPIVIGTTSLSFSMRIGTLSATGAFADTLLETETVEEARTALGIVDSRELLTANRTYYARPDGSDSNTGLANTAGGAFLTLQKAANVIRDTLDLGGYNVTVSVASGTYNAGVIVRGPWIGAGTVTYSCSATIGSVVIIDTSGFRAEDGGVLYVNGGFDLQTSSIPLISRMNGSRLYFQGVQVNAVAGAGLMQLYVTRQSYMEATGTFYVNGSCSSLLQCSHQGNFRMSSGNVTFQANVTYDYLLYAEDLADITLTGTAAFALGGHAVTGWKALVTSCSNIQWSGKGYTDIPGSLAALELSGGLISFGGPAAQSEQSYYVGSQTYNLATASGDVVVTGVGFMPKLVQMQVANSSAASVKMASFGSCQINAPSNSFTQNCLTDAGNVAADTWTSNTAYVFVYYVDGSNYVVGTITAVSSDGFTISMVKTGSPTGTARLNFTAFR